MAKLTCYGGAGSATGANFLLDFGAQKFLVDCGMQQGGEAAHEHNKQKFAYDAKSVDGLLVTHAHIDHVGLIPKLYKEGFRGTIYSTQETKELGELLLYDALKIADQNGEVLYTASDIEGAMSLWHTLKYKEAKDFGEFKLEVLNAGHILGSSMFKLTTIQGKTMLFTGDIGNSPSLLLPDVESVDGLDYLLMESVYGDRNHENREEREEKFKQIVRDAVGRGGTLLIPAFSLERTQVILSMLDDLLEDKRIPSVPVYLDSPLAIRITEIYEKYMGNENFDFKELKEIARVTDSREIVDTNGAKIIIAGSGMSTAGRILYHEIRHLPDPNSTILLMGYQSIGTLGRQIEEGMKKVTIDDKEIGVRARVEKIHGFSGHADSNALVDFASKSKDTLKKVFVAMGEPKSQIFLTQRLRDELDVDAVATEEGKSYEIDFT